MAQICHTEREICFTEGMNKMKYQILEECHRRGYKVVQYWRAFIPNMPFYNFNEELSFYENVLEQITGCGE